MPESVVALAKHLISFASVTPKDQGCQDFIANFLAQRGFTITHLPFGEVKNLWAVKGDTGPLFCFLGHTDVVPTGDITAWTTHPFEPEVRSDTLFGRGATDMKGAIAAMLVALDTFLTMHANHTGRLAVLLTSDEEGPAVDGTVKVIAYLKSLNIHIDYCLIGEPTSHTRLGDMIKHGRRGSLSGTLVIKGKQGHIAYPHLADNPIPQSFLPLKALCDTVWDEGDDAFQPTSFQIANLNAGTGATNMIPGTLTANFNFRYNTHHTAESLHAKVVSILAPFNLEYELAWTHFGRPFVTRKGRLLESVDAAITAVTGTSPEHSTTGGTSDGRFVAEMGGEIVECGTLNATAHHINEHVGVEDLTQLTDIYTHILNTLFSTP